MKVLDRLRRKPQTHGTFGRPLIEIDFANANADASIGYLGRPVPVAYLVDGATKEDAEYVRKWLQAWQADGQTADAFIPRDTP